MPREPASTRNLRGQVARGPNVQINSNQMKSVAPIIRQEVQQQPGGLRVQAYSNH